MSLALYAPMNRSTPLLGRCAYVRRPFANCGEEVAAACERNNHVNPVAEIVAALPHDELSSMPVPTP